MSDVETRLREALDAGGGGAEQDLLPLVYQELRQLAERHLAREAAGHTLQATALVHEAYLRLLGPRGTGAGNWDNKAHFFGAAAEAMRRILVDRARARKAAKRGGGRQRLDLNVSQLCMEEVPVELLDLDQALSRLAAEEPEKAELVKLRFFGALTLAQAAQVLGISTSTADRHWAYARAWLYAAMQGTL